MHEAPPSDATLRRWAGGRGARDSRRCSESLMRTGGRSGRAAARRRRARVWSPCIVARSASRIAIRSKSRISRSTATILLRIGITGKRLGETLRALLQFVLEDPARNTPDELVARARELA